MLSLRFLRPTMQIGFALAVLISANRVALAAEDPFQIMKKTEEVYLKAKSFQGVLQIVQAGKDAQGKMGSISTTQKIAFQAPNKFSFETTLKGTGSAQNSSGGAQSMKCDGKTMTVYMALEKKYMKQPAPPTFSIMQIIGRFLPQTQNFTPKLLGDASQGGKSAFHLQLQAQVPKDLPPSMTPEQKKQFEANIRSSKPIEVYIEKGTYYLLSVKAQNPNITVSVDFAQQMVNRPLSATLFVFTPPPGATETKANATQPGGVPPRKP